MYEIFIRSPLLFSFAISCSFVTFIHKRFTKFSSDLPHYLGRVQLFLHEVFHTKGIRRVMASGFNRVILVGNLTRDPEYKQLGSGQAVCRLGLASNRQFKNRQTGQMVQEVCFIDIDVWGPQAESAKQYLSKGRQVLVEGRLRYDTWQDTDGKTRSKHSIVADQIKFLGTGPEAEAGVAPVTRERATAPAGKSMSYSADFSDDAPTADTGEVRFTDEKPFEDDLPF